jgi:hypothetical protein
MTVSSAYGGLGRDLLRHVAVIEMTSRFEDHLVQPRVQSRNSEIHVKLQWISMYDIYIICIDKTA